MLSLCLGEEEEEEEGHDDDLSHWSLSGAHDDKRGFLGDDEEQHNTGLHTQRDVATAGWTTQRDTLRLAKAKLRGTDCC